MLAAMRLPIALMTLALVAAPAVALPAITSAYTKLDLDRCTRLDRGEEPQSASWRCSGYKGTALFVQNGDDRYDVDAGLEDRDALWADGFDYPGATVEWRLSRGKPFAIIYRLTSAATDRPRTSRLMIETVGGPRPGCRVAVVDGSLPNANALARAAADRILAARAPCLTPE